MKKTEIISITFSDHNGMKLEINYRRKLGKFTNMWKLNSVLLNNQKGNLKNLETNENGNTTYQWNVMGCSTSSSKREVYSDKCSH